jgi:tetratricopeptide (TPR) repeat protein
MGRLDEAMVARRRALELDPISPLFSTAVGWAYYYQHHYDQAIEWYQKALELDPQFTLAHEEIGQSNYKLGRYDRAVDSWLRVKTITGTDRETIDAYRQAYASAGITGYWQKELELAQKRMKVGKVRPWRLARIYAELGEKDQAFIWLGQAFEERESLLVFLKTVPNLDSLHGDPRFDQLLRRVGLQQ